MPLQLRVDRAATSLAREPAAKPNARARGPIRVPTQHLESIVRAGEVLVIVAAGILSQVAYHAVVLDAPADFEQAVAIALFMAMAYATAARLRGTGAARNPGGASDLVLGVLTPWAIGVAMLLAFAFALKLGDQFSRGSVLLFTVLAPAGMVALRLVLHRRAAGGRRSIFGWHVAVLADQSRIAGRDVAAELAPLGVDVVAKATIRTAYGDRAHLSQDDRIAIDSLVDACRSQPVDEILLEMPWHQERRVQAVLAELTRLPIPVRLVADPAVTRLSMRRPEMIGSLLSVEVQRAPLSYGERLVKRAVDMVLASAALVALAPLLGCIALLIRLESPGPAIFRQRRSGFSGRVFVIYKFRTMTTADDGPVVRQATRGDPRVTRLGRWLRRTSIDELPQLLNVLRGEMSIVGPRPHALAHTEQYDDKVRGYTLRHHMRPGLTGWAQVNGFRGETRTLEAMQSRIDHDLWYVNNWSLLLDLKIMAKTVFALARTEGAY